MTPRHRRYMHGEHGSRQTNFVIPGLTRDPFRRVETIIFYMLESTTGDLEWIPARGPG